jgi:5,10-methylene-tetrahydrofolate dehydrogenase/methenyl tetrahydrofolate cyclohydrolase
MILLKGTQIRDSKRENLRSKINEIKEKEGDRFIPPTLVIFQIGDNASSSVYIGQKKRFAEYVGAEVLHIALPEHVSEFDVIAEIQNYNMDDSVHGIIVQLPLPRHLSVHNITNSIDYRKDVDGLSGVSLGLLVQRNFKLDEDAGIADGREGNLEMDKFKTHPFKGFIPATAKGILSMLLEYNIELEGKKVCIIGRSVLVGKPTALLMLAKNATVTICHSKTINLKEITKQSDILISAIGKPGFINKTFVSENQILIDVGITSIDTKTGDGENVRKVCGDFEYEEVSKVVYAITPVPGGVGPLTVTSLFENLFESFCNSLL